MVVSLSCVDDGGRTRDKSSQDNDSNDSLLLRKTRRKGRGVEGARGRGLCGRSRVCVRKRKGEGEREREREEKKIKKGRNKER